jgi:hypothetical protein
MAAAIGRLGVLAARALAVDLQLWWLRVRFRWLGGMKAERMLREGRK